MINQEQIIALTRKLRSQSFQPTPENNLPWAPDYFAKRDVIPEGERNSYLMSYSGSLRAKGHTEEQILAELIETNLSSCTPPLPIKEVISIAGRYANVTNAANDDAYQVSHFGFTKACDMTSRNTEFLVEDLIERNSLTTQFGESGCGKSLLVISLAVAVSAGIPWYGHKTKEGTVFYIAGEGMNGLARRIKAAAHEHGLEMDDLNLFCSNMSRGLMDPSAAMEVAHRIEELVEEHGQPAMIVIDTLARNFGDGDENSTRDMGIFIQNIDEHLRVKFDAAVILVHHTGHSAQHRARGASALNAALDTSYLIKKDDTGIVRMSCTKAKEFAEPPPMAFKIKSYGSGDESAGYITKISYTSPSNSKALGPNQKTVFDIYNHLTKDSEGAVRLDKLKADCELAEVSNRAFKDAIKALKGRNLLYESNGYLYDREPDIDL